MGYPYAEEQFVVYWKPKFNWICPVFLFAPSGSTAPTSLFEPGLDPLFESIHPSCWSGAEILQCQSEVATSGLKPWRIPEAHGIQSKLQHPMFAAQSSGLTLAPPALGAAPSACAPPPRLSPTPTGVPSTRSHLSACCSRCAILPPITCFIISPVPGC